MANEKVNKVILGDETLIDLTADSVTASKLSLGETAHDARGEQIVGTMVAGSSELADLDDVNLTNLSDGQIIKYNSTDEEWQNADNSLANLSDVIVRNYSTQMHIDENSQVLARSSSSGQWVNASIYPLKKALYGYLRTGETQVSFTDSNISISANLQYEIFFDSTPNTTELTYESVMISNNTLTVNFVEPQEEPLIIKLEITKDSSSISELNTRIYFNWDSSYSIDAGDYIRVVDPNGNNIDYALEKDSSSSTESTGYIEIGYPNVVGEYSFTAYTASPSALYATITISRYSGVYEVFLEPST